MERIYINRECCIAYTVLALHSIYHSANKERTIEDVVKEIRTMFDIYTDEIFLMKTKENILKEEGDKKLTFCINEQKIGLTIEECAEYLGISKQLTNELVKLPDFPCIKFKRRILINKEKIGDWLEKNSGKFIRY